MAEQRAKDLREQKLASLDLHYPLYLFDIDDPRWPRRLDSLPSIYYPAKLTGWTASCSEYDLFLDKPQDLSHNQRYGKETKKKNLAHNAGLAKNVLRQLKWDDRIDVENLQLVVLSSRDDGTEEEEIIPLATFLEQDQPSQTQYLSKILRIERIWDKISLFNPSISLCTYSDFQALPFYFGVVMKVHNDDDLVAATGMLATNPGSRIRRAEFKIADEGGGVVKGIICPSRYREPGNHGLKEQQGLESAYTRKLIAGTGLQDKQWGEVVEYLRWERGSVLL